MIKTFILIALLLTSSAYANNEFQNAVLVNKIGNIADAHGKIISNSLSRFFSDKVKLERFDMQVGVTTSGDVGLLSFSGGAAAEFVWQRNLSEGLPGDDIDDEEPQDEQVDVEVGLVSSNEVYSILYTQLDDFLHFKKIKRKKRRKIIRLLRKDAEKISSLIKDLVLMPRVGNWYVGGFFKNYTFSTGLSLGAISIGKSKRIRFRFKVKNMPYVLSREDNLSRGQKKLERLMQNFNHLSTRNDIFQQFDLKRVFAIHTLTASLDLAVFSTSFSKGVQIEYKKANDDTSFDYIGLQNSKLSKAYLPIRALNESIIRHFDKRFYSDRSSELSLHQIRLKYSLEAGAGFKVVTVEKASTLEFHYKR
jgi:hypothetical protein